MFEQLGLGHTTEDIGDDEAENTRKDRVQYTKAEAQRQGGTILF